MAHFTNMWDGMSDEITYPFPNFNGVDVEIWELISNFIPRLIIDVIIHVGK